MKNLIRIYLTCIQKGKNYVGFIIFSEEKIEQKPQAKVVHFNWFNNFSFFDIILHYLKISDIGTTLELFDSTNGKLISFRKNSMVYHIIQKIVDSAIISYHERKIKGSTNFLTLRPSDIDNDVWMNFIVNNPVL